MGGGSFGVSALRLGSGQARGAVRDERQSAEFPCDAKGALLCSPRSSQTVCSGSVLHAVFGFRCGALSKDTEVGEPEICCCAVRAGRAARSLQPRVLTIS
jgi:hypothetical protein